MSPVRVLIVDDSVVIRKVLSEALTSDPEIQVAATARDGTIALSKIPLVNPDIVTLDVEMPGMSGLETLIAIRKLHPRLPVIMFSTLTERGAAITLEALSLGADDCVTKPQGNQSVEETRARICGDLIPKVKELCVKRLPDTHTQKTWTQAAKSVPRAGGKPVRAHIVAIGTSTGGPNALATLLPALADDFPVPVVVVQHMPALFTRLLAERLNKQSAVSVHEGIPGTALAPGHVWIAPGNYHMKVARQDQAVRLVTTQDPPQNSCRPSVDVLFESVAQVYGDSALAVVLTGMGSDGARGAQRIHEAGGQVIVQDEATSVVWGMPGQVAAGGLADAILPLDAIAAELARRTAPLISQLVAKRANPATSNSADQIEPSAVHAPLTTKHDSRP